jgi:hypothetical protein
MDVALSRLKVELRKLPLSLQKPLEDMSEAKLAEGGLRVSNKGRIANEDVVEQLGTRDYIQWTLEDSRAKPGSCVRYCSLFVTYYTGDPDFVPHVPEECYFGGGYQQLNAREITIEAQVEAEQPLAREGAGAFVRTIHIPARCVTFGRDRADIWQGAGQFPVLYFFKVNGKYAGNREQTRAIMGKDLFSKYSYYSKVEWQFFDLDATGAMVAPSQEQAIAASSRLLGVVVALLEQDHWPDWELANKKDE